MKFKTEYHFCSPRLLANIPEIDEISSCIHAIEWKPNFNFILPSGKVIQHQKAYNAALKNEFVEKSGWENQPRLYDNPRLIGDFRKNDIFIEVQFGNSSTIYRDYYKFHYGLTNNQLSLAVLVVPTNPQKFFPTRNKKSVNNMAEYDLADRYIKLLPIPVPILLIGLLPEN
jgi:hypothetical protein